VKALVVAGGTGSTNLQIGLHAAGIEYELLINAYDDGKSTGFVRRVAKCLGPSDIRKNLHTMLGIFGGPPALTSMLGCRFKAPDSETAELFCLTNCALTEPLRLGILEWFRLAGQQEYVDVSVANLALAGLARKFGSMQAASDEAAVSLGLAPVIHLSSDENAELLARSRSGVIATEGEIVTWNRPDDPLQTIEYRLDGLPFEDPALSSRAANAIAQADVVIISPGTLFSSILPTLLTEGFREAVRSKPVVVVENLTMDADVAGYTPEQALGLVIDALTGCQLYLVPRATGEYHDPIKLVRDIFECVNL
jgi:2-phospho-L-lactate transferase/gluconeogenesis factor (CofD/UPF0052 family)